MNAIDKLIAAPRKTSPSSCAPVILAADESIDTLGQICNALSASGYIAMAAGSAAEVLARLDIIVPDALLLDADISGNKGFELSRRIKATPAWSHLPILFMTGLADTGQIVNCYSSGGADYVSKPLRLPELIARLATHLNTPAKRIVRDALDIADIGVLMLDKRGRIVWCSPLTAHWLREASEVNGPQWHPRHCFQEAMQTGKALCSLPEGHLFFHYLGTTGATDSMLILSPDPDRCARLQQTSFPSIETEILSWLAKGKKRPGIADIMGMSLAAVDQHMARLAEKLGLASIA